MKSVVTGGPDAQDGGDGSLTVQFESCVGGLTAGAAPNLAGVLRRAAYHCTVHNCGGRPAAVQVDSVH
jgi:hypothetical protein